MLGFGALGEFSIGEFNLGIIASTDGGGDSAAPGESADRRKKRRAGFEPIKRMGPPQPAEVRKPELPPFKGSPRLTPSSSLPPGIDPDHVPYLIDIRSQIMAAEDERRRSEQDAADIADVLAALDSMEDS